MLRISPRTVALTSITVALVIVLTLVSPLGLPPPLNPIPMRLSTIASIAISIINPWAGAVGSVIGHFIYDSMNLGFVGGIPALFASWCYLPYGYFIRNKGKIAAKRLLLGMAFCIFWISIVLSVGFSLIFSIPFVLLFPSIFASIALNLIIAHIVLIAILPLIRRFVKDRI